MIDKTTPELPRIKEEIDQDDTMHNAMVVMQAAQRRYGAHIAVCARGDVVHEADEDSG